MENLSSAVASLGANLPSNLRRVRPFSCSSFISALTQDPGRGQQEVCVCVCVCERERERWERQLWILSSAMIKVKLGDIWVQSLYQPWRVYTESERERERRERECRQTEGRREAVDDNLLCFQTFSSLSHYLPFPLLFPLLFYLSSLFAHPASLWPSPAVTRICWEKKLIFSLGRESPACPLPSQTGIAGVVQCSRGMDTVFWNWAAYLYSLLQKEGGLYPLCFIFFEENRNGVCDELVTDTCGWIWGWSGLVPAITEQVWIFASPF